MKKEEQLAILRQGVESWNNWREQNRDIEIDLRGVNLEKTDLTDANFSRAKLKGADFSFARLEHVDFTHADLTDANLSHSDLKKARLAFAHMEGALLLFAQVQKADLRGANLSRASLEDAHMEKANLSHTNLERAIFAHANLKRADLINASLEGANLKAVNLEGAHVSSVQYDRKIFLRVLKETRANPKALWERRSDVILDTTARFRGIYADCYGSPRFKVFAQDQDYLEELMETKPGALICFIWWLFSNCGRSIARWTVWSFFFMLLFAAVYFFLGPEHFTIPKPRCNFVSMVYYSIVTFTTLGGDIFPKSPVSQMLTAAEVLLGYVMLGGLISIFASKLARRAS